MPGTNLTRDEAATRAALLDVTSYAVDLDLTTATRPSARPPRSGSPAPSPARRPSPTSSTRRSARSRSTAAASTRPTAYADSRIALDGLAADNELVVRADLPYSRTGEGLHRFVDPADDRVYLYSQFEVPDARRVYTTFEQPDLKAPFTFNVTAPDALEGRLQLADPRAEALGDGRSVWHFAATQPMSTYITALVAGEYHEVRDTYAGKHGDIPLGHYCRQSLVEHLDVEELVKVTEQGFAFFEDAFDYPYPFGKYDQLYVPEYNMGAMENAGCVTLRDEYLPRSRQDRSFYEFRAEVILHEMAHMWFGDLVTMRWWDDLWLNESFAEWACYHAAVEATEFTEAWTGFTNARKNWAYRQDQLPSTHPIAADNVDLEAVEVNFDGITYAKGASVLKQLVAWVGLDDFLDGLRAYFKEHAFAQHRVHRPAGRAREGLGPRPRLVGPGVAADLRRQHPRAALRARRRRHLHLVRRPPDRATADHPTLRRHRIGIGLYDAGRRPAGPPHLARDRRRGRAHRGRRARRPAPARPAAAQRRRPDLRQDPPRRAVPGDRGRRHRHARRLARPRPVLGRRLGHDPRRRDDRDRLRDARAQRHRHRDRPVRRQPDPDVRRPGGRRSTPPRPPRGAARDLGAGSARAAGARRAGQRPPAVLRPRLRRGRPQRRRAGRSRRRCSTAPLVLDGLAVDTDLRWTLLNGLAKNGRADADRIADELERDNTISGQEHAAAARALRPTAEAKAEAWEIAMSATTWPTRPSAAWCWPSRSSARTRCWRRTSRSTSPPPTRSGRRRAPSGPPPRWSSCSPKQLASQELLDRVDAWLETSAGQPGRQALRA